MQNLKVFAFHCNFKRQSQCVELLTSCAFEMELYFDDALEFI